MLGDTQLAVRHSPRLKRFYLEQNLTAKGLYALIILASRVACLGKAGKARSKSHKEQP
jgi:hypothetical protein